MPNRSTVPSRSGSSRSSKALAKSADGNRQAALYSKVHHAAIDGGAGMAIAMALYDFTQEPRKVDVPERAERKAAPSIPERAVLGVHDLVANVVTQQLKAAEAMPKVMGAVLEGAAKLANADPKRALMPQLVAPKTPFNATMGRGRSYAARSVPLAGAKAVGKAGGAKLNDVVMAISAGALRAYLKEKNKLPSQPLVAFVPISLREAGDASANNQVSGMNVPLATDIADPKERLAAIVVNSGERKDVAEVGKGAALSDFTLLGAPMMLPGLMKAFGRTGLADIMPSAVNLCISNTMGPPVPLYCAGAKVDGPLSGFHRHPWRRTEHHRSELQWRPRFRRDRGREGRAGCGPFRRSARAILRRIALRFRSLNTYVYVKVCIFRRKRHIAVGRQPMPACGDRDTSRISREGRAR